MDLKLNGKTAVITGGSVGVGLAVVEGLAAEGVDIVVSARNAGRTRAEAAHERATYSVGSSYFVNGGMLKTV